MDRRVSRLLDESLERLLRAVRRWCAEEPAYAESWAHVLADLADLADTEEGGPGAWIATSWAVHHAEVEGRTPTQRFLDDSPALSVDLRAWLEAEVEAWPSFFEVEELEPGEALSLRDVLTGRRLRVRDVQGSLSALPRGGLLARVVEHEGVYWFSGIHASQLPPDALKAAAKEARRELGIRGRCRPEVLRIDEHAWLLLRIFDAATRPPPKERPNLVNRDGDPLSFTVDRFAFDASRRPELIRALEALSDCDRQPNPRASRSEPVHFTLLSSSPHPGEPGPTVLGSIVVEEDVLVLETNSVRRADTQRRRIEDATHELLRHRSREHSDPWSAADRRDAARLGAEEEPPPEAQALLAEYKRRHYEAWLDDSLPALGGRSPREAVKTADGKRRVRELLAEVEFGESRLPPEQRMDVQWLRQELGL